MPTVRAEHEGNMKGQNVGLFEQELATAGRVRQVGSSEGKFCGSVGDFGVGKGQACAGHNAVHDVFRVITEQSVQGTAPADQFTAGELSLHAGGIFAVFGMEAPQEGFALFDEAMDCFRVLKRQMHGSHLGSSHLYSDEVHAIWRTEKAASKAAFSRQRFSVSSYANTGCLWYVELTTSKV